MKKSFLSKVVSIVLAVVMFTCITVTTVYATRDNPVLIPYGQTRPVQVTNPFGPRSAEYIDSIKLADDPRVHRIIYKVYFQKDPSDAGVGNVKLTVSLYRNGTKIDETVIPYSATQNGMMQVFVPATVYKNDVIDIYIDTGSENSATANGAIRKVHIFNLEFYTD